LVFQIRQVLLRICESIAGGIPVDRNLDFEYAAPPTAH
jgi:hypothetical protein